MGSNLDLVLLSDPSKGVSVKASSVLQKNSKLYGPIHALDLQNASSCWNSDGCPSGKQSSSFILNFSRKVQPVELRIQFQAGFVGEELEVFCHDGSSWKSLADLEVDDAHDLQIFPLQEEKLNPLPETDAIKLVFDECTDFYGRVTIYQLQVWGHRHECDDGETDQSAGSTEFHKDL